MFAAILLCKAVAIYSILISMLLVCVHSVADNSKNIIIHMLLGLPDILLVKLNFMRSRFQSKNANV